MAMEKTTIDQLINGAKIFDPEDGGLNYVAFAHFDSVEEVVGFLFAAVDNLSKVQSEKTMFNIPQTIGCKKNAT